jgi:hypothetical protein
MVADRGRSRGREREKDVFARGSVDDEGRGAGWAGRVLYQCDEIEIEDRVASKLRYRVRGRVKYVVTGRGRERENNIVVWVDGTGWAGRVLYQSNEIEIEDRVASKLRYRVRGRVEYVVTGRGRERQKDIAAWGSVDGEGRDGGVRVLYQSNEIHVKDTVTCKLRNRVKYMVADRGRGREREKDVFARGSGDG